MEGLTRDMKHYRPEMHLRTIHQLLNKWYLRRFIFERSFYIHENACPRHKNSKKTNIKKVWQVA